MIVIIMLGVVMAYIVFLLTVAFVTRGDSVDQEPTESEAPMAA